jgi:hypothetical protein
MECDWVSLLVYLHARYLLVTTARFSLLLGMMVTFACGKPPMEVCGSHWDTFTPSMATKKRTGCVYNGLRFILNIICIYGEHRVREAMYTTR